MNKGVNSKREYQRTGEASISAPSVSPVMFIKGPMAWNFHFISVFNGDMVIDPNHPVENIPHLWECERSGRPVWTKLSMTKSAELRPPYPSYSRPHPHRPPCPVSLQLISIYSCRHPSERKLIVGLVLCSQITILNNIVHLWKMKV